MNDIIFIGDIHGKFNSISNFIDRINIKNTQFIQVGDFGLGFNVHDIDNLTILNKKLEESKNFLYIIRGNHDCPKYWKPLNILKKLNNIYFVPDYTYMKINELQYLFVGGGISIDRSKRIINTSYWKNEEIILDDSKLNQKIDILVTHVPLRSVFLEFTGNIDYWFQNDKQLKKDLDKEEEILSKIFQKTKPKYWISGHFHISQKIIFENCEHITLSIEEFKKIF